MLITALPRGFPFKGERYRPITLVFELIYIMNLKEGQCLATHVATARRQRENATDVGVRAAPFHRLVEHGTGGQAFHVERNFAEEISGFCCGSSATAYNIPWTLV